MHRTAAAVLMMCLVITTGLFMAGSGDRSVAASAGFGLRFEANTNGSILIRGNANLVCPPAVTDCSNGRNGLGGKLDNNDFAMVNADADNDPVTVDDSTATMSLPPGSTVLFAGLYWSANTSAGASGTAAPAPANRNQVRFQTPGSTAWQPITADTVYGTGTPYQGFADVTGLVAGSGSGVYGVADIQAGTGVDRYAGWALAVAYQNPAEVLRALRVYDGLGSVSGSGTLDIPVSGFETPHSGPVRAEVGTVTFEGDLNKKGDALRLDGQLMSDAENPADNFFNSTVSSGGAPVGGRNPGFRNLFGVDIDLLDATDKLGHAVTSATLHLTTSGDTYYPGVVTFAIDLYAPKLVVSLDTTDVNGGDLTPGDVLEYRIEVRNEGNDPADSTVLSNVISSFTSYIPGSMQIEGVSVPDSITGDRIEVALGQIPYQGSTYLTFRVRIDAGTPTGSAITDVVSLSYTAHATSFDISGLVGTLVNVVTPTQSDLAATLVVSPAVVQRAALPAAITYLATVTNNGGALEPDAQAELTLPPGIDAGPLPAGCTGWGPVVTCPLGALLANTRATVTIPATVQAVAGPATLRASGTNPDPVPGNNSDSVTVPVNTAPRAVADTAGPGVIPVLANDDDPDGTVAALTVAIPTPPLHGAAIVLADGTIEYTPAPGWAGDDTFTYEITDPDGGSDRAVVTVRTPNAPPIAADDTAAVATNGTVTVPVTANDIDPNGDPLTVTAVSDPHLGAVSIVGNSIVFTPLNTTVGPVTFTYTVSDGQATATATLTVVVANAVPTAADDQVTVAFGGAVTVPVLANDRDINNDPLTVVAAGPATHGTVSLAGGVVTYQATEAGYSGTDLFGYTIDDGHGGQDSAQVTVTVLNAPPTAVDVSTTTPYLTPVRVDVLAGATDPNPADVLRVTGASDPAHGLVVRNPDGTLTYTPDAGWSGTDGFTYTLDDGQGGTDTGRVTIVVANAPPTARDDAVTLPSGVASTIDVLLNDDDPNGDPLTVTIGTPPSHGTATVSAGRVTYRPAAGYTGADSLHYTISDGRGGTSGATVTIRLANVPPTARPDTASTPMNTPVTIDLTGNDDDPNGDPLTLRSWSTAVHGTVAAGPAGTVVYTPVAGFTGLDTFVYTIADSHALTDTAIVTVVVRSASPIAVDDTAETGSGVPVTIDAAANDTDPAGGALTVHSAGPPGHGTASLQAGGLIRYVPTAGFAGFDTFPYDVRDSFGNLARARVRVLVRDAPVARPDFAAVLTGQAVGVDVLANDDSRVAGRLTIGSVGRPGRGTATRVGDTIRYTAPAAWTGRVDFGYTVLDALGGTARTTVTVTVTDDVTPRGVPDSRVTPYLKAITVPVLANDLDPSRSLRVVAVGAPDHGTAVIHAGRTVTYTPPDGFSGVARFTYTAVDDAGNRTGTTVTITVGSPPAVPDKAEKTRPGQPVSLPLPGVDDLGRPVAERRISQPSHGTARLNADGSVTYTPDPGFLGEDRFNYEIVDADGNVALGTIFITVSTSGFPGSPEPPPASPSPAVPPGSPTLPARPAPPLPRTGLPYGAASTKLFAIAALLTMLGALLWTGTSAPARHYQPRHRR
ncbi:Ig-like domain-containing protein [Actinoplanes regularis]|uniref:Conserved repeat domain-containing protein n=1 Tax=Actinoplanes regularis TaxID=52697 RepID=A0A239G9N5_9ACTN|nr:Ig-like domain-containing protein [Actinoplanes regularis]GIE90412.1 hypothetical protein Are01nite_68920 [Actinoplanes regularis]SNS65143.1 conserved repeat domain-containing protein [Actinoplanes regularis]